MATALAMRMPIVLKVMMRHQSIETTLMYCVGLNADRTGDALCRVQGAVLGGTCWILSFRLIRPTHQKARNMRAKIAEDTGLSETLAVSFDGANTCGSKSFPGNGLRVIACHHLRLGALTLSHVFCPTGPIDLTLLLNGVMQ